MWAFNNNVTNSNVPTQECVFCRKGILLDTYTLLKLLVAVFLGCFLATAALIPFVMRFARRIDAVDRGGYRKVYEGAMPLLGGLGIAVPLIILGFSIVLAGQVIVGNWRWLYLHHRESFDFLFSLAGSRYECLTLSVGGVAIVALGLYDDTKGMRARWKLLGQVFVALFVCLSGFALTTVAIPFIGPVDLGVGMGGLFTMLWVVGLINAFNLIDGVDGLAAGIACIGALALVALGVIQENTYVMFTGSALAGSVLAFLLFNFPPAKIFLGDTGSMFLGYTLATMSLMGTQKSEAAVIVFAPMLALSLPVFETAVSIVRRYLRGVPLFAGDNYHTHHRLLSKGYSQPKVVLTLYTVAILLSTAAILSAIIPENSTWVWCPYALYTGTLVYITWLAGYLRPTTFSKTIERRQRNKVYQALTNYAALRLSGAKPSTKVNLLLELCRLELELIHLEIHTGNGSPLVSSSDKVQAEAANNAKEKLVVKSALGQDIVVSYVFERKPDANVRADVSSCLAGIFDQMNIEQDSDSSETGA